MIIGAWRVMEVAESHRGRTQRTHCTRVGKEIIIETVDGYAMMHIDYQPGVNFAVMTALQMIQVNMTEAPLVYAWSFVNDDWIQASDIQN